ncbi:uncharacterized protein BDZ83DRAFT_36104 [Colletotrichum acutatum]|uniref:Uncharacterized protein n=1 Tax=Glomerella acutata TaxID=27357 RepID=A0AAD8XLG4_GLOAC|nr:uncharacterized protein BDZ83DRAFT_36104 [Colletotrichum acutatum]KAK1729556.1 hypothetical protein BDZ83DRAFT_36104 [Colletotrichum acutatum]
MADESLAVASRAEIISCFKETHQKPRTSNPAPCHVAPTTESSSISENFTDSGYSSPDDPVIFDSRERLQESKPRPNGIPVKLGGRDLLRFKIAPDKSTRDRFSHVINQVEPLLLARLKKKTGERIGLIAFRSMILGTTAENAHEHIVVLCPSQLLDTVNEFFEKTKIIKELCEPSDQIPSISIIVEGREPRMMAQLLHSVMAMGPHPKSLDDIHMLGTQSLSGSSLVVKDTMGIAIIATCGGMIKVVDKTGKTILYGMTAGHVFNDANSQIAQGFANSSSPKSHDGWLTSGRVWKRDGLQEKGSDYDWALLAHEHIWHFGANRCRTRNSSGQPIEHVLTTEIGTFPPEVICQEVEMIAAPDSTKPGLLSCEPTRILLGAGDAFTQAYILTLDEGEVRSGDSGAWVVGSSSYDVFGHIVATDMFGDAYVVPLDQTFNDIQKSTGAISVQLASPQDFAAVVDDEALPGHVRRVDPYAALASWHEIWHPRGSNGIAQLPHHLNRSMTLPDSAYGSADSTPQVSLSAMPSCISDDLPSEFKATDDDTEDRLFGDYESGGILLWEEDNPAEEDESFGRSDKHSSKDGGPCARPPAKQRGLGHNENTGEEAHY